MKTNKAKPIRRRWNGLLLSRMVLFLPVYVAVAWTIWRDYQGPAYTGETLRLMIQNTERTHALAVRGDDTESQCKAARLLGKLYRRAEDSKASEAWNRTAKAACDRERLEPPNNGN